MMERHPFIFNPGEWLGEGTVTLSISPEVLRFYMRWNIQPEEEEKIECMQKVELQEEGVEPVLNQMLISKSTPESFTIELTNSTIGMVKGKGVVDSQRIAWEFRTDPSFEGFEVYDLQTNGEYHMHGEYISGDDDNRTVVKGRIWKKSNESKEVRK